VKQKQARAISKKQQSSKQNKHDPSHMIDALNEI